MQQVTRKQVATLAVLIIGLVFGCAAFIGLWIGWDGLAPWLISVLLQEVLAGIVASIMIRLGIGYKPTDALLVCVPYVAAFMLVKWIWRGIHALAGYRYWAVESHDPHPVAAG